MAKHNSMSTARPSRKRPAMSAYQTQSRSSDPTAEEHLAASPITSKPADLKDIICMERRRLMRADAVLGCVAFALLYEDWLEGPNRPCFADAVAVAQDLVMQTARRLDEAPTVGTDIGS